MNMGRLSDGAALVRMGLSELLGRPPKQSGSGLSALVEARSEAPKKGTSDYLKAYSESPWLRAVTHRIAAGVSAVEWYFELDGEKFEVDTPLTRLLREGNSFHVGSKVINITQLHIDLTGDAFWLWEVNALGLPVEAWPIPPHWVVELPSDQNNGYYVLQFPDSSRLEVDPSLVLRFSDPDPFQPYGRGTGTTQSLSDEIETDEYAAKHTKNWFFNRARPDIIVSANDYTTENVRRIERQWLAKHQGYWRAHLPAFLRGQDMKIHELSQTFEQMELVKLRQHERDMVMQVFGVSPEIFGVLESSNRATIEAADYLFSRWVVVPRLDFIAETLNLRVVPRYDPRLKLKYVSPVREDKDREIQMKKTAAWSMTMNEWREEIGKESIGEEGEVYLIPLNMSLRKDLSEMSVDELIAGV